MNDLETLIRRLKDERDEAIRLAATLLSKIHTLEPADRRRILEFARVIYPPRPDDLDAINVEVARRLKAREAP